MNLQMAFLTPPFGYSLFYLKGIAPPEMTIYDIYKGVVPFILLQWIALILCILIPDIILWLPKFAFGEAMVR
jgi:TRAP-type mannitol/chloroaromatic compound transport system permease large subunit